MLEESSSAQYAITAGEPALVSQSCDPLEPRFVPREPERRIRLKSCTLMRIPHHLDDKVLVMRTTVVFDDDVAAAIARLRRARSLGLSEAVNELIRVGLKVRHDRSRFVQRSRPLGLRIDVTNVAEALEQLDEPTNP